MLHSKLTYQPQILLIGPQGSGKTSVAKELREIYLSFYGISLPIFEQDSLIEKDHGIKIPQLIERSGPKYFRNQETNYFENSLKKSFGIISSGGGLVFPTIPNLSMLAVEEIAQANLELKNQYLPHCVYLLPSNDLDEANGICEYWKNKDNNSDHRITLPADTLKLRDPHYRNWADDVILTKDLSLNQIAKKILDSQLKTLELQLVS